MQRDCVEYFMIICATFKAYSHPHFVDGSAVPFSNFSEGLALWFLVNSVDFGKTLIH